MKIKQTITLLLIITMMASTGCSSNTVESTTTDSSTVESTTTDSNTVESTIIQGKINGTCVWDLDEETYDNSITLDIDEIYDNIGTLEEANLSIEDTPDYVKEWLIENREEEKGTIYEIKCKDEEYYEAYLGYEYSNYIINKIYNSNKFKNLSNEEKVKYLDKICSKLKEYGYIEDYSYTDVSDTYTILNTYFIDSVMEFNSHWDYDYDIDDEDYSGRVNGFN